VKGGGWVINFEFLILNFELKSESGVRTTVLPQFSIQHSAFSPLTDVEFQVFSVQCSAREEG
jgi:hypothetical protein